MQATSLSVRQAVQEAGDSSEDESLASEGDEEEEPDSEASEEEEGMDWDELEEEAARCGCGRLPRPACEGPHSMGSAECQPAFRPG